MFVKLKRSLNILLLCDYQENIAATVRDHIRALEQHSRHKWWRLSMLGDIPQSLDLTRFDVIVIHYTLVACSSYFISEAARTRLADFKGLKAIFIQDEYRFVDKSTEAMREIGVSVLFTCAPPPVMKLVYPPEKLPGVTVVNVLTGYVPAELLDRPVSPTSERPIDIGYRGRNVPAWLGELGQEKIRIGIRVSEDAPLHGLAVDISFREEDRLYGAAWIKFVSSCKSMLGVESGASVVDFSGEIQERVEGYVRLNPHSTFEQLRDKFFVNEDGKISFAQISPRCFESAALRTLMILYEGNYSGVLVPWRHYVPLKKDHSNFAEVVAVLRDPGRLEEITARAYEEIACNPRWSFACAVGEVDEAIEAAVKQESLSSQRPYSESDFDVLTEADFATKCRRVRRSFMIVAHRFWFGVLLGWFDPVTRVKVHNSARHIYNVVTFYRWRRQSS